MLPALFPKLRVGNGLDARLISHDPAVVAAYQSDPLVHDRIAARLARFIADDSAAVRAAAPGWALPTLLLYAGADKLVNPAGSRAFAAAAPAQVVSTQESVSLLAHERRAVVSRALGSESASIVALVRARALALARARAPQLRWWRPQG